MASTEVAGGPEQVKSGAGCPRDWRWFCCSRSCLHQHFAPSYASCRHCDHLTWADAPQYPRGVERRERTADDHPHDDHGPPSAHRLRDLVQRTGR